MKKILVAISSFFIAVNCIGQLFPQQSMYMYNPVPLNSGAIGRDEALSISIAHRTMWRGVSGAPKTQYVSVHTPLKNENIAVGFQLINDKIAVTQRTGIFATGAYRLKLNSKMKISFGLTVGAMSVSNKWSAINTTDPGDVAFQSGDQSYWLPSIGAGVYVQDKYSFAGLSIPSFLTETYVGGGEYKVANKMNNYSCHLMGGHRFMLQNNWYISPSALLKYHASSPVQADITALAGNSEWGEAGIAYRWNESVVGIVQVKANTQLRIAYSFDYLLGNLSRYESGTHEIALSYRFVYMNNAPNPRQF